MTTAVCIAAAITGFVCGGFAAWIASEKNRDPIGWFCIGLIFPIFGLIAIAAVPSSAHAGSARYPQVSEPAEKWRCPQCQKLNDGCTYECESCSYTLR